MHRMPRFRSSRRRAPSRVDGRGARSAHSASGSHSVLGVKRASPLSGDDRLHRAPRQLGEQRFAYARRMRGAPARRSGRRHGSAPGSRPAPRRRSRRLRGSRCWPSRPKPARGRRGSAGRRRRSSGGAGTPCRCGTPRRRSSKAGRVRRTRHSRDAPASAEGDRPRDGAMPARCESSEAAMPSVRAMMSTRLSARSSACTAPGSGVLERGRPRCLWGGFGIEPLRRPDTSRLSTMGVQNLDRGTERQASGERRRQRIHNAGDSRRAPAISRAPARS